MTLRNTDKGAREWRVFVNGVEIFDAVEADDQTGQVRRLRNPWKAGVTYVQQGQIRFEKKVPVHEPACVSPLAQQKAKQKARRDHMKGQR